MPFKIEFFGSLQSPYCYFALDRIEALMCDLRVQVVKHPVLPGVIRIPDTFADRSEMELAYFQKDVARTARFLNLPYDEPVPSPVNWIEGAGWIANPDQGRINHLYNLLYQAHLLSKEYTLYAAMIARLQGRQLMLPLLLFPLIVPVLVAAVKATSLAMLGDPMDQAGGWIVLLVCFNLVYWSLAGVLFGRVIES